MKLCYNHNYQKSKVNNVLPIWCLKCWHKWAVLENIIKEIPWKLFSKVPVFWTGGKVFASHFCYTQFHLWRDHLWGRKPWMLLKNTLTQLQVSHFQMSQKAVKTCWMTAGMRETTDALMHSWGAIELTSLVLNHFLLTAALHVDVTFLCRKQINAYLDDFSWCNLLSADLNDYLTLQ